jgi:type IV pilus assembly protein PilW
MRSKSAMIQLSVQRTSRGMSLIEIMIALLIATVLIGGMLQIFVATKASYQMQQGVARVQENGRFAMQLIERSVRMAGYMGCGNDRTRIGAYADLDTSGATSGVNDGQGFFNHLSTTNGSVPATTPYPFHYERPIEAYEYNQVLVAKATAVVDNTASHWTPTLPASITGVVKGSDVLVVRYFSDVSTPILYYNSDSTVPAAIRVDPASPLIAASGAVTGGLFAIANCRTADLFNATGYAAGVLAGAQGTINTWQYDPTNAANKTWFGLSSYGQSGATGVFDAELYNAKYAAFYVGIGTNGSPVLMRQELKSVIADPTDAIGAPEELAEGIENMRVAFGIDNGAVKVDAVTAYKTVTQLLNGLTDSAVVTDPPNIAINAQLRKVLTVRISLLVRSPELSDALTRNHTYTLLNAAAPASSTISRTITPPDDGSFRGVYETNIALRNRIILRQN